MRTLKIFELHEINPHSSAQCFPTQIILEYGQTILICFHIMCFDSLQGQVPPVHILEMPDLWAAIHIISIKHYCCETPLLTTL